MWCCFIFFTHEVVVVARFLAQLHPLGNHSAVCAADLQLALLHSAYITICAAHVQAPRALHALLLADGILLLVMEFHSSGPLKLVIFLLTSSADWAGTPAPKLLCIPALAWTGSLTSVTTSMSVFCSPRLPDELASAAIGLTAWDRLLQTEPADCPKATAALAWRSCGEAHSLQHLCQSFALANFHRNPSRRNCRCCPLCTT